MDSISKSEQLRVVIPAEQIQKRVREMARQISNDYRGQTIHALALLENGFIFMADLVRALEVPVICQFIKPQYRRQQGDGPGEMLEIFFSHEPDIRGQHLLLVEGLVHSGVTSEFLMSDLRARVAASVKLATLLDRQSARRGQVQPGYLCFLCGGGFLVGYWLGSSPAPDRHPPLPPGATWSEV